MGRIWCVDTVSCCVSWLDRSHLPVSALLPLGSCGIGKETSYLRSDGLGKVDGAGMISVLEPQTLTNEHVQIDHIRHTKENQQYGSNSSSLRNGTAPCTIRHIIHHHRHRTTSSLDQILPIMVRKAPS